MIALWMFGLTSAQAVSPVPDRAVVVAPCAADIDAGCWEEATVLGRFAPELRDHGPTLQADVRLAHRDGALLVRAEGLPEGALVEVSVNRSMDQDDTVRMPTYARYAALDAAGVAVVDGSLEVGSVVGVRVQLLWGEGPDRLALPWAPGLGPGVLSQPFPVLIAAEPGKSRAIDLSVTDTLVAEAPGAARLKVWRDTQTYPASSLIPEDWQVESVDMVSAPTPTIPGWYVFEAVWEEDGVTVDLVRRRAFLEPDALHVVQWKGIVPAPRLRQEGPGSYRLNPGARLCVDPGLQAAADLMAEELLRFTGVSVPVEEGCSPGRGDLSIRSLADDSQGTNQDFVTRAASHSEAFYLEAGRGGATVLATDLRGAIYGALALADAIGPDGRCDGLAVADWPDFATRMLSHTMSKESHPARIDTEQYRQWLRRAVARGRYNMLVWPLDGNFRYEAHPDLIDRNALSRAQLDGLLAEARLLGLEVIPGVMVPEHASWLVAKRPHLLEDSEGRHACTRSPDYRETLATVYDELLDAFDTPRFFHIGHDEAEWRTFKHFPEERCPRCSGTPAWRLFADDLVWHAEFFRDRGVRPMIWHDMLVAGHNGRLYGTERTMDVLPADLAEQFVITTWSRRGNPENEYADRFDVIRAHTGYQEWRRPGLRELADRLMGEGLALTFPSPWTCFGTQLGPRPLDYHWTRVLVAGATAWRVDFVDVPIATFVGQAEGSAAFLPGYRAGPEGRSSTVAVRGPSAAGEPRLADLPDRVDVGAVRFDLAPVYADYGDPVVIEPGRAVPRLSLLQTLAPDYGAVNALRKAYQVRGATREGSPVARVTVRYADGTEETQDLWYGMDTWRSYGDARMVSMWRTSGAHLTGSAQASASNAHGIDRAFYRWDWDNPRPEDEVSSVTLEPVIAGARWFVLGAVITD